ncbi:MAG: metallophosphoesterase family protein [Rhizobiaceae bacterium]
MTLFFVADTHFGHKNIIRLAKRPFSSVEEMDEALVENWNSLVGTEDTVYHLGDFAYRNSLGADHYMQKLNGRIHLIRGNHDKHTLANYPELFESVRDYYELKIENRMVVLCHYPIREWHGCWRSAWHLFGHVHSRLDHDPQGYSLDVGVDSHDFRPITLDEIEIIFKDRDNPFASRRQKKDDNSV